MTALLRIFLLILCFSTELLSQRQEELKSLKARPQPEESIKSLKKSQSVLSLPVVDDFAYEGQVPDPSIWEGNSDVYINQTWAKSPITLGVATFDGLNRYGRPHAVNGGDSITDILSSLSIDLSSPQDSVYLSFYYQVGGWGERPAYGDDSLVLQFWDDADTIWRSIWQGEALSSDEEWVQIMQPVESRFHQSNFKFRFVSWGNRQGALDLWHLDYVYLDDQRNSSDTLLQDIAFTRPHPSLLKDFEAIPWWHLNQAGNPAALIKEDIRLHYRRNVDPNLPRPPRQLGEYRVTYNGTVIDQNGQPDGDLDDNHPPFVEVRYPVPDTADVGRPRLNLLNTPYPDEFEWISEHYYSGGSEVYTANDTVRRRQVFKNFYAYDDGSAERAYEIRNNRGGFIVQRYDVLLDDTLKGVQVYFQPVGNSFSQQEFRIIVLGNQGGLPNSILFESDSIYTAQSTDGNFYHSYMLDTLESLIETNGTVFIGIRQINSGELSLGYDQNSRNRTTAFYGELNDLYQSFLDGTIMMRPIFGYAPRDLGKEEVKWSRKTLEVYPNPSTGLLHLKLPLKGQELAGYHLILRNLQGQIVGQTPAKESWNLQNLSNGLYLLSLEKAGSTSLWQQKINIIR